MSRSSSLRIYRWLSSRLSKCRRSCLTMFLCDVCVATRSWRNSWWKCRRSYPTYSLLQRTVEQHVDIPVPLGRGGRNAGLQGSLPEQSSTATLSSAELISERIVEQIVDIPVSRGGLQDFRPVQSSSSVAHSPAAWLNTEDEPFQGGFSHFFPERKKCEGHPAHVSSSTSSAYGLRSWVDDDTDETWTLVQLAHAPLRGSAEFGQVKYTGVHGFFGSPNAWFDSG